MNPALIVACLAMNSCGWLWLGHTLGKRKTRLVIRHDCHQCTQPTLKPTRADVDATLAFDPFHGL